MSNIMLLQAKDEDVISKSNNRSRYSDHLFSDKTYSMILATAKGQIQLIEDIVVHVLNNIALVPPVAWMVSCCCCGVCSVFDN